MMRAFRFSMIAACAVIALLPAPAMAKLFRNSYVSFELPSKWECSLVDTEWVCKNTDTTGNADKQAIIILTAKEVGGADNLTAYEAHLKTQRQLASSLGTPIQSQIYQVIQKQINGHQWVDGMHANSEVRDYYTRYLATTRERIAVLVTFSAHKAHYTKYLSDFTAAINSLRVMNPRALQQTLSNGPNNSSFAHLGPEVAMSPELSEEMDLASEHGGNGKGSATTILALAMIVGAVGVFLMIRKKKSKG